MRDRIKAARTMLDNDEKTLADIEAWTLRRRVARKAWDLKDSEKR